MAEDAHAKAVIFHRTMLRVLARVGDLERAFEAWGDAAAALDGVQLDDAAQHAAIDETRAAFARIVAKFPAAMQMMGLEKLVAMVARKESQP